MEQEIQAYLSQMRLNDASENTPRQYAYILAMFQRSLAVDKEIKEIGKQDVTAFLEDLGRPNEARRQKNGYKRSSIIAVRACLSSFFQYMVDTERIAASPVPKLKRMPRPPRNPIYLTEEEKDKFLAAAKTPKDKLALNLLVATGMRMAELLGTKVRDIDLKSGHIQVKLKRGAIRQYVIVPALVKADVPKLVKTYITKNHLAPDDQLIKMTRRGLEYRVDDTASRAKLDKKISPHKLRHTFAVLLRKKGLRTVDLQNLLHHKNRETTAIYEDVDMKETEDELTRLKLLIPCRA